MLSSALSSGVSGLNATQTWMNVIGNDIANVNTTGYKANEVTFQQTFDQVLQGASAPTANGGGTDPEEVGLGTRIGSIDQIFTQGSLNATGVTTNLAIQGNSFFVVGSGGQQVYTRDGNFQINAAGGLVSATSGLAVQGRMAVNGQLTGNLTDITIPSGETVPASATTQITLSGNLDASAPVFTSGSAAAVNPLDPTQTSLAANAGAYQNMSITTYDSLGNKQDLQVVAWKTGTNTWDYEVDPSGMNLTSAGVTQSAGTHPITFNPDGTIDTTGFTPPTFAFTPADGASPMSVTFNMSSGANGLTQSAGSSSAVINSQNGYSSGALQSYTIDPTGTIVGAFSNGTTETLGQVAVADFNNPGGLQETSDNNFAASPDSGTAVIGYAGQGSTSTITSGSLEMSNVDLAQEFTQMIVAERAFQADGRVITTSDQMLQDLVQLQQ